MHSQTQTAPAGAAPLAGPARPAVIDAELAAFLEDRDEPCPACRYNLRGLTAQACPECGEALQLRVNLADPRLGLLIAALGGYWSTLGAAGALLVGMVVFSLAIGVGPGERVGVAHPDHHLRRRARPWGGALEARRTRVAARPQRPHPPGRGRLGLAPPGGRLHMVHVAHSDDVGAAVSELTTHLRDAPAQGANATCAALPRAKPRSRGKQRTPSERNTLELTDKRGGPSVRTRPDADTEIG